MQKVVASAAFAVLVTYAIPGHAASKPKSISYKDASAFELSLLAHESAAPKAPENLYIQPVNKVEVCRLPTTQDQLNRPNMRAYWDGECKNGFASGLGRDIAISDTHHMEEITVHNGIGFDWTRPIVAYDYVNNGIIYAVGGPAFPARTQLIEKMENPVSGLKSTQTLAVTNNFGKTVAIVTSAFHPTRYYFNGSPNSNIVYKFTDNSALPMANPNAVAKSVEIIDPKGNTTGLALISRANGSSEHHLLSNGQMVAVKLPTTYTGHVLSKFQEISSGTARAGSILQSAQQIEREYLFKACNGKSGVKGLDNATYTKICTWRAQFKEPYAIASANYQRQLESLKQQAATAGQQRQIQQQIAVQQQMLQQQQNQQAWNQINQANQQLQQQTQHIMQSVNSWQPPQVLPITAPGGNKVICQTIGSITTCR